MSLKYNQNNNNLNNVKPYNKYNQYYGPSPPHSYKYETCKYDNNGNNSYNNYTMKKVHGGYGGQYNKFPPSSSYRYPQFGGFDDSYKNKYTKKGLQFDDKMMSSCSTGSSEEDNYNNQKQNQPKVFHRQQELEFVVYQNSAPVYEGAPTEHDTEILMYTFIGKHSDKFVCSDLKSGPKPAESFPMPSFMD
jgi:hypothetical protein